MTVQRYRSTVVSKIEHVIEIDIDLIEYAEWLADNPDGDMETYLDEEHLSQGHPMPPLDAGEFLEFDVIEITPIAELVIL